MARPRKDDVEVVNDTGDDIDQPVDLVPDEPQENRKVGYSTGSDDWKEEVASLQAYVESLRQEVLSLEQRVQDVELLFSQPEGGVRFGEPDHFSEFLPKQPDVPDYVPRINQDERPGEDGVAWY